jgi:hypothetical protein
MDDAKREHIRRVRQEAGRRGGIAVLQKYGSEHFRALQARSWAKQVEKDSRAPFRLGYAGLRSMDPAGYNAAWQNVDGSAKYAQHVEQEGKE